MIRIELKMRGAVNEKQLFTCTLRTAIGFVLYYLWKRKFTVFFYDKIPEARNVRLSCVSGEVVFKRLKSKNSPQSLSLQKSTLQ